MIKSINTIYNPYSRQTGLYKPEELRVSEKYSNYNKSFNPDEASQAITKKYSVYPFALKGVIMLLPEYFSGKADSETFSKTCLDRVPALLTKIQFSSDGKQFEQNYKREIEIIKSLNKACDNFSSSKISQLEFDRQVEIEAQRLIK